MKNVISLQIVQTLKRVINGYYQQLYGNKFNNVNGMVLPHFVWYRKGNQSWIFNWKNWCWCWNSSTLATWCKELTHWKRPWCWERLKAGGEGDDRGWDGWMALPTQWTWAWVSSGSWWWTGRPGMVQSMGLQRVGHNWATELNWLMVRTNRWIRLEAIHIKNPDILHWHLSYKNS